MNRWRFATISPLFWRLKLSLVFFLYFGLKTQDLTSVGPGFGPPKKQHTASGICYFKPAQAVVIVADGVDLLPMLTELILWSVQYDSDTAADPQFDAQARMDLNGLLTTIRSGLKK